MATKHCVVCGAAFAAPPSSKKITCSPGCSTVRKSQTHRGVSNAWSAAARARLAARGQTPNLKLGTPAAQASPLAGPFETNQAAKRWWVVHIPTGQRYEVRNLAKWCRDNEHLFAPDPWRSAYAGLRQVHAWLNGNTPRTVSRWKDWTLEGLAQRPED